MPIIVVCRSCRRRFEVSEKFAGREGPCPNCKAPIRIPKLEEQVKIHTPEHSEATARGASGQLVLKPIPRAPTRLAAWQIVALVGGCVLVLSTALATRWLARPDAPDMDGRHSIAVIGLFVLSPLLVAAGYTFLRDPELEPYQGPWLWLRAAICATVYVACWGIYFSLPPGFTDELWKWVFVGPAFGIIGATAALATLDLDWSNAFFHFCFFVALTVLLRLTMGLGLPLI